MPGDRLLCEQVVTLFAFGLIVHISPGDGQRGLANLHNA